MFFLKHTALAAGLGILPFALLFIFAPVIFPWLLGEKWLDVGGYVQILTPWLFSFFIGLPSAGVFVLLKRQKIWLRITAVNAVLQLTPFLIVNFVGLSVQQLLWVYSLLGTVMNIVMVMVAYQSFQHREGKSNA